MKDLSTPIEQAAKSFSVMAVAMKETEKTMQELSGLLILINDRNFKKHNDAINMVTRLLKK